MNGNITSGNKQSYDDGAGIRIFQTLQPDIVLIQEFNYKGNSDRDIRQLVDQIGKDFHYYRGHTGDESGIPNGIISRFPIEAGGEIADGQMRDRSTTWAKIKLPTGHTLWALSAHLSHGDDDKRERGAQAIVDFVKQKVKKGDLLVLGGDLNTTRRSEPALRILSEIVSDKIVPVDSQGEAGTSANRKKPYDFVLPNPDLEFFHICLDLMARAGGGPPVKFPNGLVFDTRTFQDIGRFPPAQRGDSGRLNMQHMAVAKDFEIPAPR